MSTMTSKPFVLLFGVDKSLFEACFGKEDEWSCSFRCLDEESPPAVLATALREEGLKSVVFQDTDSSRWEMLKRNYMNGGLLIFFGINGEFDAPSTLSQQLGFKWSFSGYTAHEYMLTPVGKHYLGNTITKQQYSKCNLLNVPEEDRIMVPKPDPQHEFLLDSCDIDENDQPTLSEYKAALAKYNEHLVNQGTQVPLAMHRADNGNGGRFVYLGFVNGDGNIPKLVQALCTGNIVQIP